jgi:hypothetical protein
MRAPKIPMPCAKAEPSCQSFQNKKFYIIFL